MPHATTRSVLVFSVLPLTCQCDHQICVGVLCVTPNMPVSPPVLCWCSLCHPCHVHIKQPPLKDLSVHYSSCSACCSKCYININNCSLCCTECSLCCPQLYINATKWHSSLCLSQSVVAAVLCVVQNVMSTQTTDTVHCISASLL